MSQNTVREGSSPKISQHNRKVVKKQGLSRGEGLELAHQGRSHCENCGILRWEQMAPTGTWAGESALGSSSWQKLPLWQTVRKEEIPQGCAGASCRNVTTPCGYLGAGVYKGGTSRRTLWDPHHWEGQKKRANGMLLESMWSWYFI